VRSEVIGKILSEKLNVPYLPIREHELSGSALEALDESFIRAHQVIPLEVSGDKVLYLGMVDPKNQKIVREVEEITRLAVKPCLILECELGEFLKKLQ
jgi:hypothetical protein